MKLLKYYILLFSSLLANMANMEAITEEQQQFLPIVTDISIKQKGTEGDMFPRYYRTSHDDISDTQEPLRLEGLHDLAIAGTAQFTINQLAAIQQDLGTRVIVVDLREETHFIMEDRHNQQVPISAFMSQNLGNAGKTLEEIAWNHALYRDYILKQSILTLHYTKDGEVQYSDNDPVYEVANVYTEKEVVELLSEMGSPGIQYVQLPITDHLTPTDGIIDNFLELFRSFAPERDETLLFHCRAGRGRTGMMMVMWDMLANAKKYNLSFHDILKRQELLGSPDFSEIDLIKVEQSFERNQFLQHFYQFAISEDGFESNTSYASWSEVHPRG